MKAILYTRPDGGVSIVHPIINTHPVREAITEDEALERARKDIPGDASDVRVVERDSLPADYTFRDAWRLGAGGIEHDMGKARAIHRDRLRALRVPRFAILDAAYMRADEAGDAAEKARIASVKQALRDVTADPAIDAAETPEALKAVQPEALAAA